VKRCWTPPRSSVSDGSAAPASLVARTMNINIARRVTDRMDAPPMTALVLAVTDTIPSDGAASLLPSVPTTGPRPPPPDMPLSACPTRPAGGQDANRRKRPDRYGRCGRVWRASGWSWRTVWWLRKRRSPRDHVFISHLSSLRKRQSACSAISVCGLDLVIPVSCMRSAQHIEAKRVVTSGRIGPACSAASCFTAS
jgi:hypothetical protein